MFRHHVANFMYCISQTVSHVMHLICQKIEKSFLKTAIWIVIGKIVISCLIIFTTRSNCRSWWPRGLRRWSAAARLLRLRGPNPTGRMDICLLWVLCVVRQRSLRWADHSSRGVLPIVVRRFVWSRNLVNEEALAHWGAVAPKTNTQELEGWSVWYFPPYTGYWQYSITQSTWLQP